MGQSEGPYQKEMYPSQSKSCAQVTGLNEQLSRLKAGWFEVVITTAGKHAS